MVSQIGWSREGLSEEGALNWDVKGNKRAGVGLAGEVFQAEGTANPKPLEWQRSWDRVRMVGWARRRWGCIGGQEPGLSWRRHSFAFPPDVQQSRALVSIPLFRGISCPPPVGLNERVASSSHLLPSAQFLYLLSLPWLPFLCLSHAALRLISRGTCLPSPSPDSYCPTLIPSAVASVKASTLVKFPASLFEIYNLRGMRILLSKLSIWNFKG